MTRARAKALHDKVNSLLFTCDFGSTLDGMLLHSDTLCILRYEPQALHQGGTSSGHEEETRGETRSEEKRSEEERIEKRERREKEERREGGGMRRRRWLR